MGGGGTQKTTATPWSGQQPYLKDLFANAQNIFDQGYGQQYYGGPTVAPFAPQTQMAMDMQTQRALSGSPYQSAMGNYLTGSLSQPMAVNPYASAAAGQQLMGGIAPGQNLLMAGGQPTDLGQAAQIAGLDGFAGGAGGVGESSQFGSYAPLAASMVDPFGQAQLRDTAQGDYLGANPYLDQMFQQGAADIGEQFQEEIMPGLQSTFGGAGRSGSGIQALLGGKLAGEAERNLGNLYTGIYGPAYEAERGRQIQAAQALAPLGIQGMQTAADIYGRDLMADISRRELAGDIYTGGLGRAVEAGGQLGDLGLAGMGGLTDLYGTQANQMYQAASLAPSMREMEYGDIQQLARVGGATEDQIQRLMDAERAKFDFYQQAPMQALGQYSGIIQGMPGGYGTTTEGGGGSRLMGGLGGAATGAGLASALGPANAVGMANPYMAPLLIGGAALGMI